MLCFERQAADTKETYRLESLSSLLYSYRTLGQTEPSNNLKERQMFARPVSLKEYVGKTQNGTIYCFYFFFFLFLT